MNEYGKVHTVNKLAWIGSMQLFLCFAFGIVSGKLLDAGYFYLATYLGSMVFGMAVFVLSFLDPSKFVHVSCSFFELSAFCDADSSFSTALPRPGPPHGLRSWSTLPPQRDHLYVPL